MEYDPEKRMTLAHLRYEAMGEFNPETNPQTGRVIVDFLNNYQLILEEPGEIYLWKSMLPFKQGGQRLPHIQISASSRIEEIAARQGAEFFAFHALRVLTQEHPSGVLEIKQRNDPEEHRISIYEKGNETKGRKYADAQTTFLDTNGRFGEWPLFHRLSFREKELDVSNYHHKEIEKFAFVPAEIRKRQEN